jgi:hypothetical protein
MKAKEGKKRESRILARRLARPLTEDEMQVVAGAAMRMSDGAARTTLACDTWSCTGCPANDCDS